MTTTTFDVRFATWWRRYMVPMVSWIKELTQGETLMLIAIVCFGAVGANGTYSFYAPARGEVLGMCVDMPDDLQDTAAWVAEFISSNLLVTCIPWAERPQKMGSCICPRTIQEAMEL